MKFFLYALTGLAVFSSALAKKKTHIVNVGPGGQLVYDPPFIHANKGDEVKFVFNPKNHTATQSSFDSPCSKLKDSHGRNIGFDSGFQPVDPIHPVHKIVTFKVRTKDPLWFYCRQTGHCSKGMVFAINPPKKGPHTFDAFRKKALATAGGKRDDTEPRRVKVHDVIVGQGGQLTYTPPFIHAKTGEEIRFTFVAKNHTATQSSFDEPCSPQISPDGHTRAGFDSGFQPVANGHFRRASFIMPKTDKPLWFYCRQKVPVSHCGKGMVFAINPPSRGNTFAAFKAKALATGGRKREDMIDGEEEE
ncbi:Cupredoxin [Cantharellus anzutake]|uniref:Cupredoxin n=1 Tax=Cantharellus anzutake TaxID=1750568 RepID=UPI001908ADB1|nr:Cupredoxin [Cantharellus anzutake]KAF8337006.1 Cupredoxin [Cantharellus anzutake]